MFRIIKLLTLLVFIVSRSQASTTEGDYCFPKNYGFDGALNKALGLAPMSPNQMDVKFLLFTCNNPNTPQNFSYLSESIEWKNSNLDVYKTTRFIVHGWMEKYPGNPLVNYNWMEQIKNLILKKSCDNVIAVDWSTPANSITYYRSAANTQVVGKMIACVVNRLKTDLGLNPNNVHLIGHSLGGEVVGFAGKGITDPKVRQITSHDPAGPGFQEFSDSDKLNVTDGQCVNVIHTNGARTLPIVDGLGVLAPMGNYDFYPNGGHTQPGCGIAGGAEKFFEDFTDLTATIGAVPDAVLCSHVRSNMYAIADQNYIDSQKCQLIGHTCSSYEDFNAGKCGACGTDGKGCKPMPLNIDYWDDPNNCNSNANRVQYYLNTGNAEDPQGYCLHHYQIIVSVNNLSGSCQLGQLSFTLSNGKRIDVTLGLSNLLSNLGLSNTLSILGLQNVVPTLEDLLKLSKENRFTKLYTDSQELGDYTSATITSTNCPVDNIQINYMSSLDASVRQSKSTALCSDSTNAKTLNKC